MRVLVAYLATASLFRTARSQPILCKFDAQCQSGFYCVPEVYVCMKCLNCEQLKRDPPLGPPSCIKSVSECGECFKGLMKDLRGDVNSECVVGEARGPESLPYYVWVGIGAALLILALLVCFVVNMLRNNSTFKIRASTRTSVQSPCNRNGVTASAPELPPPYNAHYTPVRPSSPPPPEQDAQEDVSWGFVKRAPSTRVREARESAGSQAARVYNNPNYVRGPHLASNLPPSYDGDGSAAMDEELDMVLAHDEDTVESTWTPAGDHDLLSDNHNGTVATSTELSSQLAAARTSTLLTTHCASQDSNNNRSSSEGFGGESSSGPSNTVPAFIIKVVQNINTMQQQRQ
ncbi:uncharacterized protein LOC126973712 [Leptidea sinapis]|uniref:uncharacterized protein LOC126973712 n=1 Tax=Leptidea sinapis TaxID=189913 RepID=UPI00213F3A5F|nr:uncharacterized protein LOC126973712 [Leptidea sinapis]